MSTGNLLFRAPLSSEPPSPASLEERLRSIGLIGDRYRNQQQVFLTGERFLQLITFLGCSPFLRLQPAGDDDDRFCHIRFLGPFTQPRLMHGRNTRPPRCPHCGQRIEQWRAGLDGGAGYIDCEHCGEKPLISELDWRRNAGLGRFFVQITEVFPGEAVPLPALLEALHETDDSWDYFYIQDAD